MSARKERRFEYGGSCFGSYRRDGIDLVITRKGIEVSGHYDGIVGIEGGSITWAELAEIRKQLDSVTPST